MSPSKTKLSCLPWNRLESKPKKPALWEGRLRTNSTNKPSNWRGASREEQCGGGQQWTRESPTCDHRSLAPPRRSSPRRPSLASTSRSQPNQGDSLFSATLSCTSAVQVVLGHLSSIGHNCPGNQEE